MKTVEQRWKRNKIKDAIKRYNLSKSYKNKHEIERTSFIGEMFKFNAPNWNLKFSLLRD